MTGRLGATPVGDGVRFEVWAPYARAVDVHLHADLRDVPLEPAGDGTHVGVIDGVGVTDLYRYRLDGSEPLPDPASRHQPLGVHGPSAVVDPAAWTWTDASWTGVELADTVLYELHVGTFSPEGTFDGVVAQLPRLVALGVSTLEIMPVNAFPGARNWGYDGVFCSAVQDSYGGPDGFARLVDAAHGHGLGVVLDVVHNHLGPEGNVLGRFGPYFTDMYTTPWGPAVNVADADSDAVRRYFIESAVGLVGDFHLDGLRLDAIQAIVDPTALTFIEELTAAVHTVGHEQGRPVLVFAESSANDPRIVRDPDVGGWGCDGVWNDDVHHSLRVALTGDTSGYYCDYSGVLDLADCLAHGWNHRGRRSEFRRRRHGRSPNDVAKAHFVVYDQNHDQVGNRWDGARLDTLVDGDRRRLAAATVLLSPFTPMLFMAEEYGETAPFPFFVDHGDPGLRKAVRRGRAEEFAAMDWAGTPPDPAAESTFVSAVLDPTLAEEEPHASLLAFHRELLALRRRAPAITHPDADQHVTADNEGLVTLERRLSHEMVTIFFNFSDDARPIEVPETGNVLLDSADSRWGGPGPSAMSGDGLTIAPWSALLTSTTAL
ncbi:MAG: malto-oligosyltrehalose trehalohydrolase [Acidimicrobiales bacterium]